MSRAATTDVIPGVAGLSVGFPDREAPPGWRWVRLTDVARLESGHTPSRRHPEYWNGNVPWLTLPDARVHHGKVIAETSQMINEAGLANSAARLLPAGTVCLSRTASVGNVTRLGRPMATSQDFVNWVCSPALDPRFLMYAILSEGEHLLEFGKGTTHTTIYFPAVLAFHICMPGRAEQERIVEKLEALLAQVNTARERLTRVREILRRFRQSILAAACSGRLTEEWRGARANLEPARLVLGRLHALHALSGTGQRSNAAPPSEEAHDLDASALPEAWTAAELMWLCDPKRPITYGILKPGPHQAHGVPYVRVADFPGGQLRLSDIRRTTRSIADAYRRSTLRHGDALLSIRGSYGRLCRVPEQLDGANITQDTARLAIHELINPDYVVIALRSPATQDRMRRAARGVAVRGLNIGDVRALQVALPPVAEQDEIVRRVEALFGVADAIEGRLAGGAADGEKLPQSILAKAFRGALVPTEGN